MAFSVYQLLTVPSLDNDDFVTSAVAKNKFSYYNLYDEKD
jgi:hypothetical protein